LIGGEIDNWESPPSLLADDGKIIYLCLSRRVIGDILSSNSKAGCNEGLSKGFFV
jgi:hypothetical protein